MSTLSTLRPPLREWLDELARADGLIQTDPAGNLTVLPDTPANCDQLARHHHALQTAAAGTHPDWWNWATGRDRTTVPDPDDLPWTCANCGDPDCAHLDADLLAWCDHHWTDQQLAEVA